MLTIADIATDLGISKIRITGGEPLVRKDLFYFIRCLNLLEPIEDMAITTNGVYLERHVQDLISAGVNRLNISLDTLTPEKFRYITGKDHFEAVWRGLMAVHEAGLSPIKINVVALKGINDEEIVDLARLSTIYPFHIRFIEYMPMGNTAVSMDQQILIPEIRSRIEAAFGPLSPVDRKKHDGPARRFTIPGSPGEIGFISPVSSHFCHRCNRLRLTSTGAVRPCLLDGYEVDVLDRLRGGARRDEIREIIAGAIARKPGHHNLKAHCRGNITDEMFTIGG